MNNLFLVGATKSVFVKDYIKNVAIDNFNVYVLGDSNDDPLYSFDNCSIIDISNIPKKGILSIIESWRLCKKIITSGILPDVFVIHFVNPWTIVKYYPLWKKSSNRTLAFWGSDVYKITSRNARLLKRFLPNTTHINFTEQNLENAFEKEFGFKFSNKSTVIDFGMPLLYNMQKLANTNKKNDCKKEFNIPLDKISVHIGYNGSTIQQHLLVLEQLSYLPIEIKDKLYITIPCSYGITPGYPPQLEQALINCGIEGTLQKEYLDKNHTAQLRNSADIFIYGNETDSKSDSPIEYMYLGAYVLMPQWLLPNYQVLMETNYSYYSYDSFETLVQSFLLLLKNYENANGSTPSGLQSFQDWMKNHNSWDVLAPRWKQLL